MSNQRRRRNAEPEFFVYEPGVAVPPDVTHVLVPASVEVLPDRVFAQCRHLKEVVLSAGLREVGKQAFAGCRSLARLNLPSTLVKIGDRAFYYCTSLRELDFPEGLTEIGTWACRKCNSLVRLRLPSTVATISQGAFSDCSSLEELTLLDGIREIGRRAFEGCSSLESDDVLLPATLTAIGEDAFRGCRLLRTLKLRGGIQRIDAYAFHGCDLFEHVSTPSKALLAVAADGGHHSFRLVTDGVIIPQNDRFQVVITSECFNSMSPAQMSEFQLAVDEILGLESEWADKHRRLRALVAPHELGRRREATALLELGLWKGKMAESERARPRARRDCRIHCGADVIVPNVLPFL